MAVRFQALGALDLRGTRGDELRAILVQPKRLALLAYLALAKPARLHRRDSLFALFWPDSDAEQARGSLRQSLHFLRQSLGANVLISRGDEEVGVQFDLLWCDVHEFERALDAGRAEDALALYHGSLLEGFHVTGAAPEFDQWLERERERLRSRAVTAAATLRDNASRAANIDLAVKHARDALRFDVSSESNLRQLMALLDRAGDRTAALRVYDEFCKRLAADDLQPSWETSAAAERYKAPRPQVATHSEARVQQAGSRAMDVLPTETGTANVAQASPSLERARSQRTRRWSTAVIAAAAVVTALTFGVRVMRGRGESRLSNVVLAVGAVEDRTGGDSARSSRVLRDLLTTELARIQGVSVLSYGRTQQLLSQLGARDETRATLTDVARRAGANEILEADLYRRDTSALRLDLRRVDASTGVIRRAYAVEGVDIFAVVARLGEEFASEVGRTPPSPRLADLTTTSLVARGLYEEGVRAFYQSDGRGAHRLFQAALAEDSTFAFAAYFASRTALAVGDTNTMRYAAQAARHANRATERERLLIQTAWAEVTNNPALVSLAESVAVRFPLEPDAHLALGKARSWAGDVIGAIPHLRRAIALDSVSLTAARDETHRPQCPACDALESLISAYWSLDSLSAAERTAREWTRYHPHSYNPWSALSTVLDAQGRASDAEAAHRMARHQLRDPPDDTWLRARAGIRAGDFASVDRMLVVRVRDDRPEIRSQALWAQVISFRTQGRLLDAVSTARLLVRERAQEQDLPTAYLALGQALQESGQPRAAAQTFELAANKARPAPVRGAPDSAKGLTARVLAWDLTHAAVGYATAGDTLRLARLADSVEALGKMEAFGRDRLLHHHLRGLLWLRRQDPTSAAASFRKAFGSPTVGYTRTNFELGRVLTSLGDAPGAIAVLRPALRGELQASNYYVTHTELHEALAAAYESAGITDSAGQHYAWVANAWRRADSQFQARAEEARLRAERYLSRPKRPMDPAAPNE